MDVAVIVSLRARRGSPAVARVAPDLSDNAHPVWRVHTRLLDRCSATFSRPVPFQIGGDRLGHVSQVKYRLAPEPVDVLDRRRLAPS